MKTRYLTPVAALAALPLIAGCATSTDPAEGGFFNGVAGIASGAYERQIAEQEQQVADARARNDRLAAQQSALQAQIKAAEAELARLKFKLLQQRNAISGLSPARAARIDAILNANPTGRTDAQKLAALQKTIADARALSAELAQLAG